MIIKRLITGAAALAALGGASYLGYKRYANTPGVLGDTKYEYDTEIHEVRYDGKKIYGELLIPKKEGKLPLVIVSHGFGSNYKATKEMVGKALAMSGVAAYCYDFCGGNPKPASSLTMLDMSVMTEKEDLLHVIDDVTKLDVVDPEKVWILGESQGGIVSALAGAEREDLVRGMILYYPAFCIPDDAHARFGTLDAVPDVIDIMGKTISKKYYEDIFDLDVYEAIASFKKPVLIIHGDADSIVDVSYGRKAAQVYRDCEYHELKGEQHGWFMGTGRKKSAELTYAFLERTGL